MKKPEESVETRGRTLDYAAALYDTLLSELREKMLRTRPKRRFVRPDLPE